jgi:hypothetical protein
MTGHRPPSHAYPARPTDTSYGLLVPGRTSSPIAFY